MGTCNSAPARYPDPATTDKTLLSADELMTRGISYAQLASVERSLERRISYLNYSRDFLRAALQRLPPNDRFDFAAAHIAAVLVTLGDDPHDLKGYLESVFSSGRSEKRSSVQVDEVALRVMEALAFASPAIEPRVARSRASPALANLPGSPMDLPPTLSDQQLIVQAVTLMEHLQFGKVSVRIYNNISGEEDMRFELPLRSFGSTVDTFYARLGKYLAYFAAYDLTRLEYLMCIPGGKIRRRPEFDKLAFLQWLEAARETGNLSPLMFCPVASPPAELLEIYIPGIRILSCTPNRISMTPAEVDGLQGEMISEQLAEVVAFEFAVTRIPDNKSFSISFTDQRDNSRTFNFHAELRDDRKCAIIRVPSGLLRPRSSEDAGVFNVHGVIDGRWRTENRKNLTVLVAGEPSDAD